jgi:hypothetical protein
VWPEFHPSSGRAGTPVHGLRRRALVTLDRLRERFVLTVNDWLWGGEFRLSGLRPLIRRGRGPVQHVFGRAFDCKFKTSGPRGARRTARGRLRAPGETFEQVTRIEISRQMGWFHFDTGNHDAAKEGCCGDPARVQ